MLVEDREDDIFIVQKAFHEAGLKNPVLVARDGEEALHYLDHTGAFAEREKYLLPQLVLLDLKMPKMDGFELLKWIRGQRHLTGLLVVILTASNQIRDVNEAYKLGANSYMIKPDDFYDPGQMAKMLKDYWRYGGRAPGAVPRPLNLR